MKCEKHTRELEAMKVTIIKAIRRHGDFDSRIAFAAFIELAVESGIAIGGEEWCVEAISKLVNVRLHGAPG